MDTQEAKAQHLSERILDTEEGSSDEELFRTYAHAVAAAVDAHRGAFTQEDAQAAQLAGLRAVLSRWGRPAAPPAPEPGEVAELVLSLRETAARLDDDWYHASARIMRSAATLLQQLSAPAPVAVSERLPQPEDCDAEGVCWFWEPGGCWWEAYAEKIIASAWKDTYTHWLPFHAIPLPQAEEGEGEV